MVRNANEKAAHRKWASEHQSCSLSYFGTEREKAEVSVPSRTTFEYGEAELSCLRAWEKTTAACVGVFVESVTALMLPTMQLMPGMC